MSDNSQQIAEWNGALGERWAEHQIELDGLTQPYGAAALQAADPRPGERVIDVGCGCGDTTLRLSELVGPNGSALGVDVSAPMLEVAARRARLAGATCVRFERADAASADLPLAQDLVFSRFGVMFFADPAAAFVHIRRALKPGGRLAFCCWRTPQENLWATAPLAAARRALNLEAPPSDPSLPGPFAFADRTRISEILTAAGFSNVSITPFDAPFVLGATPLSAAESAARFGPLGRLLRELGPELSASAVPAVAAALAPYADAKGVRLPGASWIVAASSPSPI